MPSSWPRYTVAQLQADGVLLVEDGNHGEYRPRTAEFGAGQCAFIRAADMDNGTVLFDSAERINDVAVNRIRKGIGRGGDVLFSHKGTVGKLAIAPLDSPQFVCSPQTTFWRTLCEARLSRSFLFYYMQSRAFTEQWMGRKGETDMADYVSLTAQRELFVSVPPIDEQHAIASVLGSLDDKIEQNRRTGRKLEELARAVFKAWFVDFEPVKAKAAGATAFPGMPPETFATLPNTLKTSPLGPVPEGWEDGWLRVAELERMGTLLIGDGYRAKRSELAETGAPFIRAGNVNGTIITDGAELLGKPAFDKAGVKRSQVWDTVFTSKGTVGRIGLVTPGTGDVVYAPQVCFWRALNREALSPFLLYLWMKSESFSQQWMSVKGQTDMADFVSLSDQRAMTMCVPPSYVQRGFDTIVRPIIELIAASSAESAKLATLRDYLLPRLLSGRVRVTHPASSGGGVP